MAPSPVPPTDPFMIETPDVRSGTNTIAKPPVAIVGADSKNPTANVINGHEQNIPDFDDLQYACTFPLQTPKTCVPGDAACDCSPDKTGKLDAVVAANSPLCQNAQGVISDHADLRQSLPRRARAAGVEGPGRQRHRGFDLPEGDRRHRRSGERSELRLQPGSRRDHRAPEGSAQGQMLAASD